jgi:hypothetical protein
LHENPDKTEKNKQNTDTKNKKPYKNATRHRSKVGIIVLFVVFVIVAGFFVYRSIQDSYYNNNSLATIDEQRITVDEYKYYLNKAKGDRLLPTEIVNKIEEWNDKEVWSLVIDGKKTSDMLKEKALYLTAEYKVQLQKSQERDIRLVEDESILYEKTKYYNYYDR